MAGKSFFRSSQMNLSRSPRSHGSPLSESESFGLFSLLALARASSGIRIKTQSPKLQHSKKQRAHLIFQAGSCIDLLELIQTKRFSELSSRWAGNPSLHEEP